MGGVVGKMVVWCEDGVVGNRHNGGGCVSGCDEI